MESQKIKDTNLYINCFSSCIGTLMAEIATLPVCTVKTIYQNNKNLSIPQTFELICKNQGVKFYQLQVNLHCMKKLSKLEKHQILMY